MIFGWLAALGASLILSGIVVAVVGAILGAGGASSSATEGGTVGLIGLLLTLLLAFIVGGYVAGRLASHSGIKHGLLVPVVALVVTVILAGRNAFGAQLHREPERRDVARRPERRTAWTGHNPDQCGHPRSARPVRRGRHRRCLGRENGPQAPIETVATNEGRRSRCF